MQNYDNYFMIFSDENYKELCEIAEENNDFLLKRIMKDLRKEPSLNAWFVEVNKNQFCLVICELRHLRSKSDLIPTLIRQGENQDKEFAIRLETTDRDCNRYNLLSH